MKRRNLIAFVVIILVSAAFTGCKNKNEAQQAKQAQAQQALQAKQALQLQFLKTREAEAKAKAQKRAIELARIKKAPQDTARKNCTTGWCKYPARKGVCDRARGTDGDKTVVCRVNKTVRFYNMCTVMPKKVAAIFKGGRVMVGDNQDDWITDQTVPAGEDWMPTSRAIANTQLTCWVVKKKLLNGVYSPRHSPRRPRPSSSSATTGRANCPGGDLCDRVKTLEGKMEKHGTALSDLDHNQRVMAKAIKSSGITLANLRRLQRLNE